MFTTRFRRRRFLRHGLLSALSVCASGCGTLLYPERRGQPAGPLDWRVVALDAIGLFFFFVPGVIAFAVDFSNGTIYLPQYSYRGVARPRRERQLTRVATPTRPVIREDVERVVSSHIGHSVVLEPGEFDARELASVDDFWRMHDELAG